MLTQRELDIDAAIKRSIKRFQYPSILYTRFLTTGEAAAICAEFARIQSNHHGVRLRVALQPRDSNGRFVSKRDRLHAQLRREVQA